MLVRERIGKEAEVSAFRPHAEVLDALPPHKHAEVLDALPPHKLIFAFLT